MACTIEQNVKIQALVSAKSWVGWGGEGGTGPMQSTGFISEHWVRKCLNGFQNREEMLRLKT